MKVFSLSSETVTLQEVYDVLAAAGRPIAFSAGIAGFADPEEMASPSWEATFLRWKEPELHDVYLLERMSRGEEEAEEARDEALRAALNWPESGEQYIVLDTVRRAETIYELQALPALLQDDDHPAWEAMASALSTIASSSSGIIYSDEGNCFFDAEGEPLLVNEDLLDEELDEDDDED